MKTIITDIVTRIRRFLKKLYRRVFPNTVDRIVGSLDRVIKALDEAISEQHEAYIAAEQRIEDLRAEIDNTRNRADAAIDEMHRAAVVRTKIADLIGA